MIRATYRTDQRHLLTLHFPAAWDTPAHVEAVARSLAAIHGTAVSFRTEIERTPAEAQAANVRRLLCDAYAHADDARLTWAHTDEWAV